MAGSMRPLLAKLNGVQRLHLQHSLNEQQAQELMDFLLTHKLAKIDISYCQIQDQMKLFQVLKYQDTLQFIDLRGNNVKIDGYKQIAIM